MENSKTGKTVSVVMCTYNGEAHLREQIESILHQTYPVSELVIQDDGSTDGTWPILEEYRRRDARVRLFRSPQPLGFNYNFSTAFLRATGDYIASSDQDDVWREDKIEVLLRRMKDNKLVFHNSLLFSSSIAHPLGKKNAGNIIYNDLYLLLRPFVPGHECFFSREILPLYKQVVDRQPRISYDSLLLLVAASSGEVEFIDEPLVYWRRHPRATSYNTSARYSFLRGMLRALSALGDRAGRNKARAYFTALSGLLTFRDTAAGEAVRLMSDGSTASILRLCWICLQNRKKLYPSTGPLRSRIRSFFVPLYFLRDCTKFIIH